MYLSKYLGTELCFQGWVDRGLDGKKPGDRGPFSVDNPART